MGAMAMLGGRRRLRNLWCLVLLPPAQAQVHVITTPSTTRFHMLLQNSFDSPPLGPTNNECENIEA